jgi:pimeloyl-ACP methyl ester carboxylesterase
MSFVTMFPLPRLTALQFADRDFRYNMITRSYHNPSILSSAVVDELMLGTKTDDYLTGMSAMLSHFPSSDEEVALLSELRLPVLALWAIDKNELPENSIRLAKNLPHARTAYIEEAGHYLHEEQPEQTFAEINRSLNEWFPKSYEGVLP